jgi:hypothetical protein
MKDPHNMIFSTLFCKYYMVAIIWMTISCPLQAAFETQNIAVRYHALAGAGCAAQNDPSMMLQNPASSHGSHSLYLYASFSRLYNTDIHSSALVGAFDCKNHMINLGVLSLGNELYHETTCVVGISKSIRPEMCVGINTRLGQLSIAGYGEARMAALDLGLQVKILNELYFGSTITNCLGANIGKEPLPQGMQSGFHALLSPRWSLHFDIFKDVDFATDIRCGAEYSPFSSLTLRLGTGTKPSRFAAGFGLLIHNLSIEYGFDSHLTLGLTHQCALALVL